MRDEPSARTLNTVEGNLARLGWHPGCVNDDESQMRAVAAPVCPPSPQAEEPGKTGL